MKKTNLIWGLALPLLLAGCNMPTINLGGNDAALTEEAQESAAAAEIKKETGLEVGAIDTPEKKLAAKKLYNEAIDAQESLEEGTSAGESEESAADDPSEEESSAEEESVADASEEETPEASDPAAVSKEAASEEASEEESSEPAPSYLNYHVDYDYKTNIASSESFTPAEEDYEQWRNWEDDDGYEDEPTWGDEDDDHGYGYGDPNGGHGDHGYDHHDGHGEGGPRRADVETGAEEAGSEEAGSEEAGSEEASEEPAAEASEDPAEDASEEEASEENSVPTYTYTSTEAQEESYSLTVVETEDDFALKLATGYSDTYTDDNGSYGENRTANVQLQDSVLYMDQAVTYPFGTLTAKETHALRSTDRIYDEYSDYFLSLTDTLKFESDDDANETALNGILDGDAASVTYAGKDGITLTFNYAKNGTYALTIDPDTKLITHAELDLSESYLRKLEGRGESTSSLDVSTVITMNFAYGNQTIDRLTDEAIAEYPSATRNSSRGGAHYHHPE